jgi:hypothetical protein
MKQDCVCAIACLHVVLSRVCRSCHFHRVSSCSLDDTLQCTPLRHVQRLRQVRCESDRTADLNGTERAGTVWGSAAVAVATVRTHPYWVQQDYLVLVS